MRDLSLDELDHVSGAGYHGRGGCRKRREPRKDYSRKHHGRPNGDNDNGCRPPPPPPCSPPPPKCYGKRGRGRRGGYKTVA